MVLSTITSDGHKAPNRANYRFLHLIFSKRKQGKGNDSQEYGEIEQGSEGFKDSAYVRAGFWLGLISLIRHVESTKDTRS